MCITFANTIEAILPDLRLFAQADYIVDGFSGVSPRGHGDRGWLALASDWVDTFNDFRNPKTVTAGDLILTFSLEDALVHEADHLLGADGHVGPPGAENAFTISQQLCSPYGVQWQEPD